MKYFDRFRYTCIVYKRIYNTFPDYFRYKQNKSWMKLLIWNAKVNALPELNIKEKWKNGKMILLTSKNCDVESAIQSSPFVETTTNNRWIAMWKTNSAGRSQRFKTWCNSESLLNLPKGASTGKIIGKRLN